MTDLTFLKPMVRHVLNQPYVDSKWTVQGFGFLRTYFGPHDEPKRFRLNLWDSTFTVPGVSTIHDHPWHFTSTIVAGAFCNVRYEMGLAPHEAEITHHFTTIKTGEGGGMEKGLISRCRLIPQRPELYKAGDVYSQDADEIHETIFADGTVTLNERRRVGDGEHARVFWPAGTDWVDAEPRPATRNEVSGAIMSCIREWF